MTAVFAEVERKYEADDGVAELALTVLDRLPGTNADPAVARHHLSAVYYDTADIALAADGITLRRREGGTDAGWHLKLPSGKDTRTELRRPLTPLADGVPAEFVGLVLATTLRAPLAPVARIDTDRVGRRWTTRDGRPIVEVVVDRVTATDLRPSGGERHWTEVEVELGAGPRDLLDQIERGLADVGLHPSAAANKLARTLGMAPRHEQRTGATAGDVVMAYVAAQVAAIKRNDVGVRLDRPDAVHRARVAIRRLRSTFKVFRAVLPATRTAAVAGELSWLGERLGAARDAEVQRERFTGMTPDPLTKPERQLLETHFDTRQRTAKAEAVTTLESDRYLRLLSDLNALVATPPLTDLATHPADQVLPRLIRHAFAEVRADLDAVKDVRSAHERDLAVHKARRAGKRARYAVELARPLHPEAAQHAALVAATFQDLIGEYQDSVVARQTLAQLTEAANNAGISAFGFGRCYEHEVATADRIAPELERAWRKVERAAKPLLHRTH